MQKIIKMWQLKKTPTCVIKNTIFRKKQEFWQSKPARNPLVWKHVPSRLQEMIARSFLISKECEGNPKNTHIFWWRRGCFPFDGKSQEIFGQIRGVFYSNNETSLWLNKNLRRCGAQNLNSQSTKILIEKILFFVKLNSASGSLYFFPFAKSP